MIKIRNMEKLYYIYYSRLSIQKRFDSAPSCSTQKKTKIFKTIQLSHMSARDNSLMTAENVTIHWHITRIRPNNSLNHKMNS